MKQPAELLPAKTASESPPLAYAEPEKKAGRAPDADAEPFVPPTYIGLSGHPLSWAIGVAAGAGFLMFGYDQGVMGSLFTLGSFRHRFDEINTTDHLELKYAVMQGGASCPSP